MTTRKAIIPCPDDHGDDYMRHRNGLARYCKAQGHTGAVVIELTQETGAEFNATRTADEMTRYLVLDSERRWVTEWEVNPE